MLDAMLSLVKQNLEKLLKCVNTVFFFCWFSNFLIMLNKN